MVAWNSKNMEAWKVCIPLVANLLHFNEEQDPDAHESKRLDPDPHQKNVKF
jgi:hypothetical protein